MESTEYVPPPFGLPSLETDVQGWYKPAIQGWIIIKWLWLLQYIPYPWINPVVDMFLQVFKACGLWLFGYWLISIARTNPTFGRFLIEFEYTHLQTFPG